MKKILAPVLIAAAITLVGSTSCATFLSSGQFGHDSIVPPALNPAADRESTTLAFVGASLARGSFYPDDQNLFGQAGLLRVWRRPMGTVFFDGQAGASGWYGEATLHEHGGQYPNSAAGTFAFYGGSAQAGAALGIRVGHATILDAGLRGGLAYEAGPYRDFRAAAAAASADSTSSVIDRSPNGWSGNLGGEFAITFSSGDDSDIRLGAYSALSYPDLGQAFSPTTTSLNDMLFQLSLAVRYGRVSLAAAWNQTLFNQGANLTIGYLLP